MFRTFRAFVSDQRGDSNMESLKMAPVFLLLVMVAIGLGQVQSQRQEVTNVTNEAARFLSTDQNNATLTGDVTGYIHSQLDSKCLSVSINYAGRSVISSSAPTSVTEVQVACSYQMSQMPLFSLLPVQNIQVAAVTSEQVLN